MSKGPPGWSFASRQATRAGTVNLLVVLGILCLNLLQQPGRTTFDTKLDLQFAPADFLARSLSLWNADWAVGGLQNQASGYLFPMGPYFVLGDFLGVPMWIWERLWSALVMLAAYEGARRLALAWPGVGRVGAILAGLSYAFAPRVLTTVGGLSGETLPGSVLPWTVLPVVLYLTGRMTAWPAFVLSAATVPWMGGQNATLVVACLILPGLLLLLAAGRSWRRITADVAGWTALAVAAGLWWLVPLFLLGGYGPPFLDFVESSRSTAGSVGWTSALRGTNHWVAFFPGGAGAGWEGGYRLASSPGLLVTTLVVAGVGLAGLLSRGLWARKVLVASVLVGLGVLTAGSGGWGGSVLSEAWLDALDGPLAPLRNIHKFDPLVRLPLSLGVGAFATSLVPALLVGRRARTQLAGRRLVLGAAALAVLAAAVPAATGSLRSPNGAEEISPSWTQAVAYLEAQPDPVRVLVLPGSGSAVQTWGRTVDEPIQVLDAPAWVARSGATVAPAATMRLLDSIQSRLATGRPYDGLAETMDRMGVTHLIVRNDLDRGSTEAPSPETVHASLARARGVSSVARFGRTSGEHPDVEIFATDRTDEPLVALAERDGLKVVQGGPEVVDDLALAGLVGRGEPTVLADSDEEPVDIVTDSNRRVERNFGRLHESRSAVMTAAEDFRITRAAHEYTGPNIPDALTTAEYDGVVRLEASTSSGYADTVGEVHPEEHPYAAFDDSLFTSWATSPVSNPLGQWLEVEFAVPRRLGPVDLAFDVVSGARVTGVELSTDAGSVTVAVGSDGAARDVLLPVGPTETLRLAIVGISPGRGKVRLADFAIGGLEINRSLRLPGSVSAGVSVHLQAETPRRACIRVATGASCSGARQRLSAETPGFARRMAVTESGEWGLGGRVVATEGPATEELLAPLLDAQVRVEPSSVFAGDPLVAGAHAFDGRMKTSWYAAPTDENATLVLSWGEVRTIRSVEAYLDPEHPGRLPSELLVEAGSGRGTPQTVSTTGPGAGRMRPVRTDSLRITLPRDDDFDDADAVGVTELRVPDIEDLRHRPRRRSTTGTVCGFGPKVELGGRVVETAVRGRIADVLNGRPLDLVPCGDVPVTLGPGERTVRVTNPAGFAVSELWLEPAGNADAAVPPSTRPEQDVDGFDADAGRWSPSDREVVVAAPREAVLALGESFNAGWSATAGKEVLTPIAVDGWRQGWIVPAGSGTVDLAYEPQRAFTLSTVAGLSVAALLNLCALALLVVARRRPSARSARVAIGPADRSRPGPDRPGLDAGPRRVALAVAFAAVLAVVSAPLAVGSLVGTATRSVSATRAAAAGGAALALAAGVAIVGPASVIQVPAVADVVVALVVGALAGRVLAGDR